ncbi:hypothetical protein [Streptomyces sp. NPDC088557]|uniref:hypothetical protein n=1 Tax=Streptomyces sp. NPDC088557 TaxID=3365867 RepID=UPI0038110E0B
MTTPVTELVEAAPEAGPGQLPTADAEVFRAGIEAAVERARAAAPAPLPATPPTGLPDAPPASLPDAPALPALPALPVDAPELPVEPPPVPVDPPRLPVEVLVKPPVDVPGLPVKPPLPTRWPSSFRTGQAYARPVRARVIGK